MNVNPKLATLMRVIDDNQDKMTEGEYLEAMNALAALHRDEQQQQQQQHAPIRPIPVGHPPASSHNHGLFLSRAPEVMHGHITEARAWERVTKYHPDPFVNRISAEEWMQTPYDTQFRLVREATEYHVDKIEEKHRTPEPTVCPFITRHAFGPWNMEHDGECQWECVCGYTGKVKNWKKHEASERHQDWAKHRTVSRQRIQKMKTTINDDEAGNFVRFATSSSNPRNLYPGGIRLYTVLQDKNEWTHPELFIEVHLKPIPAHDGTATWFVHPRTLSVRQYVH